MGDIKYTSLGDWAKDTCDAIRSKDGTSEPIAHGDIPERIKAIPTGSDTSGITATAADVSENVKFLSKDGVLTQGTMPEIAGEEITLTSTNSETTIAEGHHDGTGKVKADYSGLADVSGLDAEAANVRSGKTFIGSSGTKETGSMTEYSDTTAKSIYSNGTWSLTDGYYNNAKVYVSVSSASTTVDNSSGTTARAQHILSGYTCQSNGSRVTGSIETSSASGMTITPKTSGYTILGERYLSSDVKIEGDSNLIASNIKSGVSIFGVSGTYSGGSSGHEVIETTVSSTSTGSGESALRFSGYDFDDIKYIFVFTTSNIVGAPLITAGMFELSGGDVTAAIISYDGNSSTSIGFTAITGFLISDDTSIVFNGNYIAVIVKN